MTTPAVFVSHGAPTVALEEGDYPRALAAFAGAAPQPRAIVVVSAHWEARAPVRIAASPRPSLVYDFSGFSPDLYALGYPAPGSPDLAEGIAARLSSAGIPHAADGERGWDHGVWVPLRLMYPEARIPVVEVSLPVPRRPEELMAIGRALAPLREEGALLLGSGGIVHNLARVRFGEKDAPVVDWARAFDDWIRGRLEAGDVGALLSYRTSAPHADLAVPTSEHLDPLFVVLGAASEGERVAPFFEGFHYGSLSMRCFAFGN